MTGPHSSSPERNVGALDALIADRVASLTLDVKVCLLSGADAWAMHPIPEIGLRRLVTSDGPVGVRGETWSERDTGANLPSPTAIAASWDEDLVRRLGRLLAAEARRKGVDVLLAPTVNLHRSPLGGRHFECYSEDPLLTARIGTAYVEGVQAGGVAATVKHFVANDSETERMTYDARIDERALRELYLSPFEDIVLRGRVWAVMAAYNAVDGHTMTESPLLDDILKGEWGFDGVVMSDWFATRSTVPAAKAGLDLAMPGPDTPWGDALLEAVRQGEVAEETIDEKVRRLLLLAARVGALDVGDFEVEGRAEAPAVGEEEISATVREAAAAGIVLARNESVSAESGLLPLRSGDLRRVAVLGQAASTPRIQGGGSATVFPSYSVSPLDGLRNALGADVEVTTTTGARASAYLQPVTGDVKVRFLDSAGNVLGEEERGSGRLWWLGSFGDGIDPSSVATIEAATTVIAETSGAHSIGIAGVGQFAVTVDGATVLDTTIELEDPSEPFVAVVKPPHRAETVEFEQGRTYDLVARYAVTGPLAAFSLGHEEPARPEEDELAHAAKLAADADVAVVVVGTGESESEAFDRDSLALPGRQNDLVARVAAANPRTIVVVNTGAPVEMPWADEVPAIVLAWFGGQEFGNALADVLLGEREPGGRLPTTWPVAGDDCPVLSTKPDDGVLTYAESLHIGYRGWQRSGRTPLFPFGHGLGYTDWEYGSPTGTAASVTIPVRNTGARRGRTVVQVYASRASSEVERPASWLVGFAVVDADPGETVEAVIEPGPRAFAHWDGGWRTEPGPYDLAIGASSTDIRGTLTVHVP